VWFELDTEQNANAFGVVKSQKIIQRSAYHSLNHNEADLS